MRGGPEAADIADATGVILHTNLGRALGYRACVYEVGSLPGP